MILRLERQKSVDRGDRGGIVAPNSDFASPGKGVRNVVYGRAPIRHHRGARDRLGVDEAGKGEIALGEPDRDVGHVRPYGGDPGGIDAVPLQHDSPPVGQRLEDVGRSVLIHPHGDRAALLNRGKRAVGP